MTRSFPTRHTVVLAVLFATFGAVMLDRMAPLFLGPFLVAGLGLSATQIGLLASVTGACWAVSSLVFGALSDRIGRRPVLLPAIMLFSASSWLSGLATSFEQLLATRALLGLAEGPCWSVIMAIVGESSRHEARGRNIGMVNAAGPLVGSAVAPVFTTQVAAAMGWEAGFFAVAVPGFLCAALVYWCVPETLRRESTVAREAVPYRSLLRNRTLWTAVAGATMMGAWVVVFHAFAPLYMTATLGQPATTVGLLLGATGLGGCIWSFFGTRLADRWGRRPALCGFAAVFAVQPLLFMFGGLYEQPVLLALLGALVSTTPAAAAVIMVIVPAESVPPQHVAAAIGLTGLGAEFIGATFGPAVAGMLADHHGAAAPMVLCMGGALALLALGLLLRPGRPAGPLRPAEQIVS